MCAPMIKPKIYRRRDLADLGLDASWPMLARLERDRGFPQRVKIYGDGSRAVGWPVAAVDEWIDARKPGKRVEIIKRAAAAS